MSEFFEAIWQGEGIGDGEGVMNVALNSSTSILTWLVAPKTTSIDQKTDSHHES